MSITNNWDVYTQRNWDSKGREKLIKAFDKIIEDFPETTVGSQILNNITNLQNQVTSLNNVRPQYWGTINDIPLSDSGNTDTYLSIGFNSEGWLYKDVLITGQILITTIETSWGLSISSSAPLSSGGGFSRIIDFVSGATVTEDYGAGLPAILVSGLSTDQVIWDFSYLVRIENLTTFTLRATDVGGSLGMGSWVKAVVAGGAPIV